MKEKTNFWEVISEYFIEVPIIQRDYAQGRKTDKVKEIRQKIISDCYISLSNLQPLEFDFVYGNIEARDEQNIFIPLDGQQRLTTLFLLHWYLAVNDKQFDKINLLQRFSYKTRISSRDFCSELVKNASELPTLSQDQEFSDIIKNMSWFFLSWEKDPTVSAMLTTLDDIHKQFWGSSDLFDKITGENCPILFRFIELKEFGLEDDLYIKMNARGKALTDFENFKAKFEQHIEKYYPNEIPSFLHKIDGNWTDLFWAIGQSTSFDEKFLNFFKAVVANNVALKINTTTTKKYAQSPLLFATVQAIIEQLDERVIRDIKSLDYIASVSHIELVRGKINIAELFEQITSSSNSPYRTRILFYAVLRYLSLHDEDVDENSMSNWLRVVYNLTQNTEYDEITEFARSIKMIDELTPKSKRILNYISERANQLSGFSVVQIDEERIKATLILKSEAWKELVYDAEAHPYFNGQMGFLLYFSGVTDAYKDKSILGWDECENQSYMDVFCEYHAKMKAVFGDSGIIVKKLLWERALLTKGFYWIEKGDRFCLLQNNIHRDYSWKRLLRDTEKEYMRWNILKSVLDEISVETIEDDLQQIISESQIVDLRKYLIRDHRMMDSCRNRFIHRYNNTYLLLNTSTTGGYHKELRSYALYLNLLDLLGQKIGSIQTQYSEQCGIDSIKMITRINGFDIIIKFDMDHFKVKYNDVESVFENEKDVISYLSSEGVITLPHPQTQTIDK